jgi:hypothetical protein
MFWNWFTYRYNLILLSIFYILLIIFYYYILSYFFSEYDTGTSCDSGTSIYSTQGTDTSLTLPGYSTSAT